MNSKALAEALRAVLPFAVTQADVLRGLAAKIPDVYGDRADDATHAVTGARLALQDAEAAALDVREEYRYAVTFPDLWAPGDRLYGRTHVVHVMADCEAQAENRALAALAAAGFEPTTAGVLRVERVVA